MISRQHRFHGLGSLRPVYRHGKTVRAGQLSLKFMENSRRRSYRAAVVVSRKVHKSAVVRNRIRRRVYEALRRRESDIAAPYDLVFTAFNEQLATMNAADLQAVVDKLLTDSKVVSGAQRQR